jgi:hypothetical protein
MTLMESLIMIIKDPELHTLRCLLNADISQETLQIC